MKYLVVKCTELTDAYECDALREPIYVGDSYEKYDKRGYEIYTINDNGSLTLIRNYETASEECVCVCVYDINAGDDEAPERVVDVIKDGDRKMVNKKLIKKLKQEYGFTESLSEIMSNIQWLGYHGEEINNKWIVIGERFDDRYPQGY